MAEITHDVVVHKANVPLLAGESLRDFTRALSDAGRTHLATALSLPNKGVDVYMVESFATYAVYNVYRWGEGVAKVDKDKYYRVDYARDKTGAFTFTTATEVRRVTTFKPVAQSVAKSADGVTETTDQSPWEPVEKGFWSGVIGD